MDFYLPSSDEHLVIYAYVSIILLKLIASVYARFMYVKTDCLNSHLSKNSEARQLKGRLDF
jgi:hypothetical protein